MMSDKISLKNSVFTILMFFSMFFLLLIVFSGCNNNGITGKAASSLECSMEVEIQVLEVDGAEKVCARQNLVELTLENLGTDLEGFSIEVGTSITPFIYDVEKRISRGTISRILIPYNKQNQGEVQKIIITPVYKQASSDKAVMCSSRQLRIQPVTACSE